MSRMTKIFLNAALLLATTMGMLAVIALAVFFAERSGKF